MPGHGFTHTTPIPTYKLESKMTAAEKNRAIARAAARGVYLYAAQSSLSSLEERLVAEARATDDFSCTDEEMLRMAAAEFRKLRGQSRGGYVTAAMRK